MGELIVGRLVREDDGSRSLKPLSRPPDHPELALHYQETMAALISAAYAYKSRPTAEHLVALGDAASRLAD